MPRPTPRPVLTLWLIPELVAAVDEAELEDVVVAMIKEVGDVVVMTVEAEDDDDDDDDGEAVVLVRVEGSMILKWVLPNAGDPLPGSNSWKLKVSFVILTLLSTSTVQGQKFAFVTLLVS